MIKSAVWSHLLKKSLMENFIFHAVYDPSRLLFLIVDMPLLSLFSCNSLSTFSLLFALNNIHVDIRGVNFRRTEISRF